MPLKQQKSLCLTPWCAKVQMCPYKTRCCHEPANLQQLQFNLAASHICYKWSTQRLILICHISGRVSDGMSGVVSDGISVLQSTVSSQRPLLFSLFLTVSLWSRWSLDSPSSRRFLPCDCERILAVVDCLSVCLSICQMRELWQNEWYFCPHFYRAALYAKVVFVIVMLSVHRLRSNLPQTMTTWHQTYHTLSRSTGQRSRL